MDDLMAESRDNDSVASKVGPLAGMKDDWKAD